MKNLLSNEPPPRFALLQMGFRPFFLGASIFSIMIMTAWSYSYHNSMTINPAMSIFNWHAHEMIFGYGFAVIAGFLLTAVRNWTGIQTIQFMPLLMAFTLWLCGRILFSLDIPNTLILACGFDISFGCCLAFAIAMPLIKSRQWPNASIFISKVLILTLSNLIFYLGLFGIIDDGIRIGLFSGLYLIMALIFTMGRRVIPFFVETGVDYPVKLENKTWIDISSLLLFICFWLIDLFTPDAKILLIVSTLLCLIHTIRLYYWYTPDILKKPLLWILYLGYAWIIIGFALKVGQYFFNYSPMLSLHAFAYGGVGLITIGMMARVAIGHTGGNVKNPPDSLRFIFIILAAGAIVRIIFPLFMASYYPYWIMISQLCWITSFILFIILLTPMLIKPRPDGKPG